MGKNYGYVVWLVVTLFVVYAFGLNTAAAVFSEVMKTSLHASSFAVSLASSTFILGFACMQIPAGFLLDRFDARFIVSGGLFLLALGNVFISYADTLLFYALANLIQGLGASFAFIAAAVLISQWFAAKQFPIFFGLTQAVSCILAGVIHYYLTLALLNHTWYDIYRYLAVFGFALFIVSLLTVKSPISDKTSLPLSLSQSLKIVLCNKQIILCSLAAATSFGVLLAYAGFWYIRVQNYYMVDNLQAVLVSGMLFLGIGIGTPLLGWLSNKLNSRVMVIHVSLCLGTMFLLLGIYLPHYAINTLIITKLIAFLIGFFLSGSMLFYTLVSQIATDKTRGVAISVLNTAVFLFNSLILFIPYLFVTAGSTQFFTYLWLLPFFLLIAVLVLYFIKDSKVNK